MKVNVSLTIEIDAAAYAEDYGIAAGDVRADLKDRVPEWVRDQLAALGYDVPVEGR